MSTREELAVRKCEQCSRPMERTVYPSGRVEAPKNYARRRYCSHSCHVAAMRSAPATHGTAYRYRKGCRCDDCRAAFRVREKRNIERKREVKQLAESGEAREVRRHGADYAYTTLGCRCEVCTEWFRAEKRAIRRRTEQKVRTPVNRGKVWTGPELELLSTRTDLTRREVADMLGRTVAATQRMAELVANDPKYRSLAGVEGHGDV